MTHGWWRLCGIPGFVLTQYAISKHALSVNFCVVRVKICLTTSEMSSSPLTPQTPPLLLSSSTCSLTFVAEGTGLGPTSRSFAGSKPPLSSIMKTKTSMKTETTPVADTLNRHAVRAIVFCFVVCNFSHRPTIQSRTQEMLCIPSAVHKFLEGANSILPCWFACCCCCCCCYDDACACSV